MSSPSQPPSNADSVAGFDRTIPLAVEALEHRARDVESVAGPGNDAAVVKAYAAARFFIVQIDVDARVLLRAMAADPAARAMTEKLLALVRRERVSGVYRILGDLQGTARTQIGHFADSIDLERLTAAQNTYEESVRDIADDRPFKETLVKIRNEVAAHMFSYDVGIESAATWVVPRSAMPKMDDAMFSSLILSRSIQVLRALHTPVRNSLISAGCDRCSRKSAGELQRARLDARLPRIEDELRDCHGSIQSETGMARKRCAALRLPVADSELVAQLGK